MLGRGLKFVQCVLPSGKAACPLTNQATETVERE